MQRIVNVIILSLVIVSCQSQQHNPPKDTAVAVFRQKQMSESTKEKYAAAIEQEYQKLLLNKGFNGSILMAKNGEIIFEDYHGFYDRRTGENISANTPLHLASVSKTFTGMTILKLWEQGRISLDDSVQRYLPQFPYHDVTIRLLLSHQSGLPKYENFMSNSRTEVYYVKNKRGKLVKRYRSVETAMANEYKGFVTNEQMLQYMVSHHPPLEFKPGKRFRYCNTNFALLALIVEKITHLPFPRYMADSVFNPLGLQHTYIFSSSDISNYVPSYYFNKSPYPLERFDCIYGDKNLYSTPRDLLLWDKALYNGSFVKASTVAMAARPQVREGRKTGHYYGLGWHLQVADNKTDTIMYHNGWWHGNNAVFTRLTSDTATLIILGNKFNKNIYRARQIIGVFSTISSDTTDVED